MAGGMTLEDHRRGFAAAMAVLIAEFNVYLDRGEPDPVSDGVSYREGVLWLSPDELAALTRVSVGVLRESVANEPGPGRMPYLLSPIVFPTGRPSGASPEHDDPNE
jgi:hypothetical protein